MGNLADALYNFLNANRGLPFRAMSVFNYLLEAALAGGILIVLMLLVRKFLRGRLGNRAVYVAWLLVAVRLLTPLAIPNPLMNELRPTHSMDAAARPVADQFRVRFNDALNDFAYELNSIPWRQAVEDGMSREEYNRTLEGNTFPEILAKFGYANSYGWTGKWFLMGYGAAALGVAAWMAGSNASFRRRLRKSRAGSLSPQMQEQYEALCAQLGVKPIPVHVADPLPGACLVGAWKPAIWLPLAMPEEDIPFALRHELCHYKARDNWWSMLRLICCAVQWFNPLVWVAAKCSRTDCELACDDRATASMDEEERRLYAQVLLTSAARRSAPGLHVLATGMTMNGKRLKQRIAAIIENRTVRKWAAVTFLCIACAVAVMAFCTAESDPMSQSRPGYDNDLDDLPLATEWYAKEAMEPLNKDEMSLEALASRIMHHALIGANSGYSFHVWPEEKGVSAMLSGSGWYFGDGSYLRLDEEGRIVLLRAKMAGGDWEQSDRTTPPNTDASMQSYLSALSKCFFDDAPVTGYDPSWCYAVSKGERNGYRFQAYIGGVGYEFIFDMDWMKFDMIRRMDTVAELAAMPNTPENAMRAAWKAMAELGIEDPGHAMTFVEKEAESWLVTLYVDETMPEQYHEALTAKFGAQPRWTLEARTPIQGEAVAQVTLKPIVYTLMDDVPADAKTGVTSVYTETYNLIAGETLMRDDTLPVGVPYTILAKASAETMGHAVENYPDFVLIRYESPRYGGAVVDRWTHDPEAWRTREQGVVATPVPESARETLAYQSGDKTLTILAADKRLDDSYAGFDDHSGAALKKEDAFILAVEAVEKEFNLPAEGLLVYQLSYGYQKDAADFKAPYWQFDFFVNDFDFFEVILHDGDGEVLYIVGPAQGNG